MSKRPMPTIVEQIRGVSYKPEDLHDSLDDDSIILLRANNIDGGKINFDDVVYVDRRCVSTTQVLRKGDILICASSGSKNLVGKAAQVDFDQECTFGAFCKVARPREVEDSDYIGLFFQSPQYRRTIAESAIGININNIRNEHIDAMTVSWPDSQERCSVISTLNALIRIITARQRQLHALDTLIKARFVEMFDLESCCWSTFGDTTDFIDYRGKTPVLSETGTIRMINAKSVGKGFFKYIDEYVTEETYNAWMHRGYGCAGDILFVTEGHTFGNTCLIPQDLQKFALGQRVITIKGHEGKISNAFLSSYMQTDRFWKDINVFRTGGTAQGIRSKDLVKVQLPLPAYNLQNQFAAFVSQVDKSKVVVQEALNKTQLLYDSLMQQYFG